MLRVAARRREPATRAAAPRPAELGVGVGLGIGSGVGFGVGFGVGLGFGDGPGACDIAEGNRRTGRDRCNRFRIALGSAAEVGNCLDAPVALGYGTESAYAEAQALADRVRAMTYRLSNPKG